MIYKKRKNRLLFYFFSLIYYLHEYSLIGLRIGGAELFL